MWTIRGIKPMFMHYLCKNNIFCRLILDVHKAAFPKQLYLQSDMLKYVVVLFKLLQRGCEWSLCTLPYEGAWRMQQLISIRRFANEVDLDQFRISLAVYTETKRKNPLVYYYL